MRLTSIRGHHVWADPLNSDSIVIDAGAHRGEFSSAILEQYGCRCFLVEANPALASELVVPGAEGVVAGALTAHDGNAQFGLGSTNLESGTVVIDPEVKSFNGAIEVEAFSLASLMAKLHLERVDLLKLDIEGAEFEVIESTPPEVWRQVGQITVEFHDFQPRFAGRNLFERAKDRLEKIGFICAVMSFRTHGDVLFLNRHLVKLTNRERIRLRYFARFESRFRQYRIASGL